jgi:hypothetical protein
MRINGKKEKRERRKKEKELFFRGSVLFFFLAFSLNLACQPNQEILKSSSNNISNSANPAATLAPRKTTFEQDVQEIKDAGLENIFVLRRKDGGTFDTDDAKYIRQNTPLETNRFIYSEERKILIIGSGFSLPLENIEALKNRYNFEDLSKPIEVEVKDSPANANK